MFALLTLLFKLLCLVLKINKHKRPFTMTNKNLYNPEIFLSLISFFFSLPFFVVFLFFDLIFFFFGFFFVFKVYF